MVSAINSTSPYAAPASYLPRAPYQLAETAPGTTTPTMPRDSFSRVSSMVATGAGGAFVAYKFSEQMAESIFNYTELGELGGVSGVAMASFKEMGMIGLKGAGLSGLVSAGISAVANGVGLAQGKVDKATATRNVIEDTITGAVGGLGAVTLGGLGGLGLVKLGVTGLPITIATVAIGAAAGVGASYLKDKFMHKN